MSSLLYLIAVILIIGWILGFFVYSAGGLIHILLIIAIIALIIRGDQKGVNESFAVKCSSACRMSILHSTFFHH